jgi:hypothetical protein
MVLEMLELRSKRADGGQSRAMERWNGESINEYNMYIERRSLEAGAIASLGPLSVWHSGCLVECDGGTRPVPNTVGMVALFIQLQSVVERRKAERLRTRPGRLGGVMLAKGCLFLLSIKLYLFPLSVLLYNRVRRSVFCG